MWAGMDCNLQYAKCQMQTEWGGFRGSSKVRSPQQELRISEFNLGSDIGSFMGLEKAGDSSKDRRRIRKLTHLTRKFGRLIRM